jgi:cytochrome c biogenesis protein ResB
MKPNLSQAERVFRILVGSILLTMSLTDLLGTWGFYFGMALLLSSSLSFCLFYAVVGINGVANTAPTQAQQSNAGR